jgi:hypothetical protein
MEKTPFGSKVTRSVTGCSLSCFESEQAGNWQYLTSQDARRHHAVWFDTNTLKIREFCEGDIIEITAPDQAIFDSELNVQIRFAASMQ